MLGMPEIGSLYVGIDLCQKSLQALNISLAEPRNGNSLILNRERNDFCCDMTTISSEPQTQRTCVVA